MYEFELIHASVFDPSKPGIFRKANKSDHATYSKLFCKCKSCPLRQQSKCIALNIFGSCPYGKFVNATGPTPRSKTFREWVKSHEAEFQGLQELSGAESKLAFIGEHVWLPYPHMDSCKQVPFMRHGDLFISGLPFLAASEWNLKNVIILIDFRPYALMGGEIKGYQLESVPKFLGHLREVDVVMWASLIKVRPELDTKPNYVGRTAFVKTLKPGITIGPKDSRYPVIWKWDGQLLTTNSISAYESVWSGLKNVNQASISVIPSDDTTTVVTNNDWVYENTKFVD